MIESVSHITFIVKDLERMTYFLRKVFDAEEVYDSTPKNFSIAKVKFFIVGGTWIAAIEGNSLPERSYNHVAFKVSEVDFDKYVAKVKQLGVDIRPGRSRIEGEGRSLYFYDYDNHLFEFHTGTLQQRLDRYNSEG
jgi:catechol 2,3-dioxygenase-like lactoylglutathione lyase family enzyme